MAVLCMQIAADRTVAVAVELVQQIWRLLYQFLPQLLHGLEH